MKKFVYVPAFNPDYFKPGNPYQLMHRDHPNEACVAILKSVTQTHLEFLFINSQGMVQTFQMNIEDTNVITVSRLVADPEDEEGVALPEETKVEKPRTVKFEEVVENVQPSIKPQDIMPGTYVESKHTGERFVINSVDTDHVYIRSLMHEDNNPAWLTANDLMRDFNLLHIMQLTEAEFAQFSKYFQKPKESIIQTSPSPPAKYIDITKLKVGDVIAPIGVIGSISTYRVQEMIVNPMTYDIDYVIIRPTSKIDSVEANIRIERSVIETQYKVISVLNDDYGVSPLRPMRFA